MPKTNLAVRFREILTNATQDPDRWSNLPTRKKQSDQGYRFDGNGFTFTHPETAKVTQFPVSLDVPRISWSSGVAYDPSNNMLYGVSLGGEGFLYSYDIDVNKWTVLASMDGHDAHGLLFEPEKNRWVMAGVWKNLTTPMIATYDVKHGLRVTQIPLDALSGVTDIYDRGNGPGPDLRPMAIDGNKVLAIATPPEHFRGRGDVKWRAYQIDVTNGNVALVGYHGD